MSSPIAVGIDGSAASRAALDWAAHRAQAEGCALVLIHVAGNSSRSDDDSDSLALTELDYARATAPDTKATLEVHHGDPVTVLAEEAHRFALLVIGTHKTGFLRGRVFGSTSFRLAARSDIPLAIIPIGSGRMREGVLVGIDDEMKAVHALRHAAGEAARSSSPLTLIHVRVSDRRSPVTSALDLVKGEHPALTVRAREVVGMAGEVLINASASAEILFIGGPTPKSGLGAVGFDVLLNIAGPTILVPKDREFAAVAVG